MSSPPGLSVPFSGTELLLAAVTFCLVLWAVRAGRPRVPRGQQSPPGPWGWPLLGHALSLGRAPHETLARLSQRYGPVLQVRLGLTPVLVLGGPHAIRQALVRQADAFKGRPALHTFSLVADGQSLTFSPDSGPVWAARRRLAQGALRGFSGAADPGAACSRLETHVAREAEALAARFLALTEGPGRFDPHRSLLVSVTNVICAICFGRRYDHEDQELLGLIDLGNKFGESAASGNLADFLPILRLLPNRALSRFRKINKRFHDFVQQILREHYRTFEKGHIRDVTDSLIEHCQERKLDENANLQLPDEKIISVVMDLFGAGFDTVTTALSWSLLYLVTHPDVQEKIHRELDAVVGRARRPRLSDRPQLPYLEAFILETFRHSSFVPFTIPHSTTRDTTLNGFYIPKGTCVFVNQWQVNHDPELWGDPGAFRPERFLGSEGRVDRARAEQVLLFGLGRRRCVGEGLARAELFLFLALLLHRLGLRVAAGARVDARPVYGLTMKLARCPCYQAWPRA